MVCLTIHGTLSNTGNSGTVILESQPFQSPSAGGCSLVKHTVSERYMPIARVGHRLRLNATTIRHLKIVHHPASIQKGTDCLS